MIALQGKRRPAALAAGVIVATLGAASAAMAHGGGGGGSAGAGAGAGGHAAASGSLGAASAGVDSAGAAGSGQTGQDGKPLCDRGYVAVGSRCQRVHAGILPDQQLYAAGRALALAGFYARALPILEAVQRRDDPMVYTMRGFAMRKLGDFPAAMTLYRQALAIDPRNVNTHEYIGEGYVQTGRLDLAKAELVQVRQGCGGTACEQYEDLAQAIATGRIE